MLIVGAKGFAKEVLEVCKQNNMLKNIAFYDDISEDLESKLYNEFLILRNIVSARSHFKNICNSFTIGIGDPSKRKMIAEKFISLGGELKSTISSTSCIGSYNTVIEEGCNVMQKVVITNDVQIKRGTIINQLSSIGHDVVIGEFCEICPNVSISGNCSVGSGSFIGTGAILLPNVKVGNNVVIGAGAVVSKNLPNNCLAVGVPAKIIKQN